jgi:hypothetical protein
MIFEVMFASDGDAAYFLLLSGRISVPEQTDVAEPPGPVVMYYELIGTSFAFYPIYSLSLPWHI